MWELRTHEKLKCQSRGKYNQTGDAKPFDAAKLGKRVRPEPKVKVRAAEKGDPEFRARMAEVARRAQTSEKSQTNA